MDWFNSKKTHSIRKGVMGIIEKRITDAQVEHDKECEDIDGKCTAEVAAAYQAAEDAKDGSAHKQITKVLGKLI